MRYAKQELAKELGWAQEKLQNSRIVVTGSNNLASFILADLIAMGFGNITRIGESSFPFLDFHAINPDVELEDIPGEILNREIAREYIGEQDFIIESSKSPSQKKLCLDYAQKTGIPAISAVCSDEFYSMKIMEKDDKLEEILKFHQFNSKKDGIINAIIASGIIVD